jgi:hypothetical protein
MDFHTAQTKEFTMTGTQGSPLSENHGHMLRMFLALEEAKDTIRQFEAGEITRHSRPDQIRREPQGRLGGSSLAFKGQV